MRFFAQRSSGVLGRLCFYEIFRTEKQRGFGGDCASMRISRSEAAGFWGDGASMRFFTQRSSGVLGVHENFRTKKQRGFGGTLLL